MSRTSLQRRKSKPHRGARGAGYRPPRDRKELLTAIASVVLIVVVTASLLWFLRPGRDNESTGVVNPVRTLPTSPETETTVPTTDTTTTTLAP